MKRARLMAAAIACSIAAGAHATEPVGDKNQQGEAAKRYDRKIEQAAIQRAASKIGDIRGSIEGHGDSHFIAEDDLRDRRSQRLGFPIIQES